MRIGHIASPVRVWDCPVVVGEEIRLTPGALLRTERDFLLRVVGPDYSSEDHEAGRIAEKMRIGLEVDRANPTRTGAEFKWICELLGRMHEGKLELDGAPAPGEAVSWVDPSDLLGGEYSIGRLWPEGGELRLGGLQLSNSAGIFGDPGTGKTYLAQTVGELYLRHGIPVFAIEMSPDEEYSEWAERLRQAEPDIPVTLVDITRNNPIPLSTLRLEELLESAGVLTRDQEDLLGAAYASLASQRRSGSWSRQDLYDEIDRIARAQNRANVANNLLAKLKYRFDVLLPFLADTGTVFDPPRGGLHIFRLATHPYRELVAAVICTLIEEKVLNGDLRGGVILIDEAHLPAPADRDLPSRYRIRYFIRLARHIGLVAWVISQSPKSIDRQVFDLLRFLYIFAVSGENLMAVRDRLSGLHPRLVERIPNLPTGVCLLTGPRDMLPFPIFFRAEGRKTEHPAPTRNIFDLFGGSADEEDERE